MAAPVLSGGKPRGGEAGEILDEVWHSLDKARIGVARLATLLDGKASVLGDHPPIRGGLAPWQKRKVIAYIQSRLDKPILLKSLAQLVSLSVSHFCRAFRESTGQSPHTYITEMRVNRAKEMMLGTRKPLSQIALACGFADQAHLSRLFRRRVGQTPHAWRRLNAVGPMTATRPRQRRSARASSFDDASSTAF